MDTIETERLLLRPWKIDDAAEAASLFGMPATRKSG